MSQHHTRRVDRYVQPERQLRRSASHQAQANPECRKAQSPPPLSIDDDMLGGEKSGRHRYAQSWFDEPPPRQLFHRCDDAGDRSELDRKRVGWRSRRLVAKNRATQRVTGQNQGHAKPKRQRGPGFAGPGEAIDKSSGAQE